MRHDFGLGLYSHHSHKCIIFSFDNGRSPPLFAPHLLYPKVEFEEYVRIRYFTEVSDLGSHGLKGNWESITQGAASLALGYALLAFQAVSVQIRNLSYFTTKAHAILCAKDW